MHQYRVVSCERMWMHSVEYPNLPFVSVRVWMRTTCNRFVVCGRKKSGGNTQEEVYCLLLENCRHVGRFQSRQTRKVDIRSGIR